MNKHWLYEEGGNYVDHKRADGSYTVFRPSKSGTHAAADSTYGVLSVAIARVLYLARGAGRHASEAETIAANLKDQQSNV